MSLVRPVVARLSSDASPSALADDYAELWVGLESALRGMLHGSALSGEDLVVSVRERGLLTLEQTHALLAFHGVVAGKRNANSSREREILSAVSAFFRLDDAVAALSAQEQPEVQSGGYAGAAAAPDASAVVVPFDRPSEPREAVATEAATRETTVVRPGRLRRWIPVVLLAPLLAAAGWYMYSLKPGQAVAVAIAQFSAGNRDSATALFSAAAARYPKLALPHIYLGRIAREAGDLPEASRQLEMAVRLEPDNAVAHRELGSVMLASGQLDLARRFYARALEHDPNDALAAGLLGCTLLRLGDSLTGQDMIARGGSRQWAACLPDSTQAP